MVAAAAVDLVGLAELPVCLSYLVASQLTMAAAELKSRTGKWNNPSAILLNNGWELLLWPYVLTERLLISCRCILLGKRVRLS